jgi:hypothetical protein
LNKHRLRELLDILAPSTLDRSGDALTARRSTLFQNGLPTSYIQHYNKTTFSIMSETSSSEEDEVVEIEEEDDDEEEEEDDDDDDQSSQNELGAWRQVHEHLTKAVAIAREAVASKKLQRRFWLEEVCANLTEEGKLTQTSVWKRPVPPKKTAAKKPPKQKEPTAKKRKKKAEPKPKRIKKKKTEAAEDDVEDDEEPKAKKIRLKLKKPTAKASPPPAAAPVEDHDHESQETSDEDDDESETETGMIMDYQHDTGAAMHASDYAGHSWGSGQQHNSYMVSRTLFLLELIDPQ